MNILLIVIIVVVVLALIIMLSIATYSYAQFKEVFEENNINSASSYTTASTFAQIVNNNYFNNKLKIITTPNYLGDCYVPSRNTIMLSEATYDNASISSLAVIAHELGHAIQDQENFAVINKWIKLKKIIRVLGFLIMPLIFAGIITLLVSSELLLYAIPMIVSGLILFCIALSVKLYTLPIEKDASVRGLKLLEENDMLNEEEIKVAKQVLKAAYLTYIGDFFRALLSWTFLTHKTKLY